MKKKLFIVLMLAMSLMLTACGGTKEDESLKKVKEKGTLVVGTSAEYPPYEWHQINGTKDEIVGVDIEIAKAIAEALGVKLEIKDMQFDGLIAALGTGEVDLVLAGMGADEDRKEAVEFSNSYHDEAQVLIVKAENESNFKSVSDLEGKNIGAQLGSLQYKYAEEHFKSKLAAIPDNNNAILDLKNGTYDALFMSKTPALKFTKLNPELKMVELDIPNEAGFSAAVKKGNLSLIKEVNKVIDELKSKNQIETWLDEFIAK